MYKYGIIVAGGTGTRMGTDTPKQFLLLDKKPVLWHTIKAFTDAYEDIQLVLVLPEDHQEKGFEIAKEFPDHRIRITTGGSTRFQSVKNGLMLVDAHALVFVHDGVRCLVTPQLIHRCAEAAAEKGNAIPAITATDSVRLKTSEGNEAIDRKNIQIIQTPQTFYSDILKKAFEQEYQDSFTDEASVVEKTGITINLIEGESTNIKITRPQDILIAENILKERNLAAPSS